MFNYSQPDFYHFADDSIALAQIALRSVHSGQTLICADLFAGCGVVGIEFLLGATSLHQMSFFELQSPFLPHFEANCLQLSDHQRQLVRWRQGDFLANHSIDQKFDLILANPPFFDLSSNRQAIRGGEARAICRSWSYQSCLNFLSFLKSSLTHDGKAFLLLREDQRCFQEIADRNDFNIIKKEALGGSSVFEVRLNID